LQAALAHSLPLKEAELGVSGLTLWGRIDTLNGRDYLIASATDSLRAMDDKTFSSMTYLFSQDGVHWSDLGQATSTDKCIAANIQTILSGDPQMKHYWPPKADQEADEAGDSLFLSFWAQTRSGAPPCMYVKCR